MNNFIRSVAILLLSACFLQSAGAQFNVSGPGFIPDGNGMNPDAPQSSKIAPKVAAVTVVKDCADCPEMVLIPAGHFIMGAEKNANEKPPHKVTIRSFLMGKTEVTQGQWVAVMGSNPSRFTDCGQQCPVDTVSWDNAQGFITKLNQKTGQKYRLPSESEWEYASKAETSTEWSHGNDESKLGDYAWYEKNSGNKTQVVGQKLPNAFGLFDIHGNVWEWVQDCYHDNYAGAPTDGNAWITSCGDYLVLRGGSWYLDSSALRSAFRFRNFPSNRFFNIGIRLARDL